MFREVRNATRDEQWFRDPMCDPVAMRQRAWRYFRHDLAMFGAVNRVAGHIERLREGVGG